MFFWWLGSCCLVSLRFVVARQCLKSISRDEGTQLAAYDFRFRALSILNQLHIGAGIWLAVYYQRLDVAYLVSIFHVISCIVTVISVRGDLRSFLWSMPLLIGQSIVYWLWFAEDNQLVMAGAFLMLFLLTLMYARNMQTDFREKISLNHSLEQSIHELTKSQKKIAAALAQAEDANRSKSFFLAAASHDLRQPIYAASLLQESLSTQTDTAEHAETVTKLGEAIGNISNLLDNLLDLSRFEAGTIEVHNQRFPIQTLLDRIETDYRATIEKAGLEFYVARDISFVVTDFVLALRLVNNLVDNSIKYTPEGKIGLCIYKKYGTLRLDIVDTGVGISNVDQQRIFKDYVRLNEIGQSPTQGVGLGLAIVRHISELSGLPVTLESEPGKGTTVSVLLPLAEANTD